MPPDPPGLLELPVLPPLLGEVLARVLLRGERAAVDRVPVVLRVVVLRAVVLRAVVLRAGLLRVLVVPVELLRVLVAPAGVLRVLVLRVAVLRVDVPVFVAPPVLRLLAALERVAVLAVVEERVLFARFGFLALVLALERDAVERDLLALLRAPEALRELDARRAPPLLDPEPLSSDHFPDNTRCAASATASAISDPSRVALDTTVVAAWLAESAASIPASRIFLRADGLALIAAAAAASPAASISLLIAALVILSTVLSLPRDEDELRLDEDVDLEDPLRVLDFAIANLLFGPPQKTLQKRKGSVSAANGAAQSGDFAS